jgi:hypothetical protein
VAFNTLGAVVNANNCIEFPVSHPVSITLPLLGSLNAAGNREFLMVIVQCLGMALSQESPNNPGELNAMSLIQQMGWIFNLPFQL